MLEKIRQQIQENPRMFTALILCFCLGLTMQGIGWAMWRSAELSVKQAEEAVSGASKQLDDLQISFEQANRLHRAEYLKSFETASLGKVFLSAKEKMEVAKNTSDPADKKQLAGEVVLIISQVLTGMRERLGYLELLDRARKDFNVRVIELGGQIEVHKEFVEDLIAEGYFPRHFQASGRLRAEAELLLNQAEGMYPGDFRNFSPSEELINQIDYLAVWRVAQEGLGTVSEAKRLAERIPALAKENKERIQTLARGFTSTSELYRRAFAAAQHMERYAPYRCLAEVNRANNSLSNLATRLEEAGQRNNMLRQDFEGASSVLNAVASQIAQTDRVFVEAIDRWRDVQDAVSALDREKQAADGAMSRTASRIRSYSHNSQTRAESLLRDARAAYRNGDNLRGTDPIQSRDSYLSAKSKANEAYNAVDTSSDDDSSSSFGSSSGSSGSSGGGFFGGSDSSPGGGSFGGPSGGDFGGPSGGGVGNGNF